MLCVRLLPVLHRVAEEMRRPTTRSPLCDVAMILVSCRPGELEAAWHNRICVC
jgi:hypothetical protein